MAIMTMSAGTSTLNSVSARPYASSPLVPNASSRPPRPFGTTPSFPVSRPLRPFPAIASALSSGLPLRPGSTSGGKRPVKIIEPPANTKCEFVLNLTQAEFSRQD